MTFADAIKNDEKHIVTENGAFALNTTDGCKAQFF